MNDLTHSANNEDAPLNSSASASSVTGGVPFSVDYGLGLVCIHSLDGRLISVSPAAAKALGYEPEEMVGRDMREFLPADVRNQLPDYLNRIRAEGTASGFLRVLTKSGEERVLAYANICRQEVGNPAYVLGHAADVTELKRAEQQLRAAEQRFRSLIQFSAEVVIIATANGDIEYVSPVVHRALGYSTQDVVGRNVFDYVHPDDLAAARGTFAEALQKPGRGIPIEVRLRKAEGSYVEFDVIANNLLDAPGVGGIVVAARDLTGRKRVDRELQRDKEELERRDRRRSAELAAYNRILVAEIREREQSEKSLRESRSLLEATLESTADGILVVDTSGKIVSHNRRFAELWGIPEEILVRGNDQEALRFVLDQLKSSGDFISRVRLLYDRPEEASYDILEFKDGKIFERYSQPQKIAGRIVGRVWSFRDITERKRLEEHLRQAQKMEAIGRLAGGVAHDFNNLLMIIMGHCKELRNRQGELKDPARENVEQISAAAERATSLTKQLLAFSRRQVLAPTVLDANLILADLWMMLRRLIGEHIELVIHRSSAAVYVEADRAQLEQVIVNLVVNARDAMPRGGTITIEAQPVEVPEADRTGPATVRRGSYVLVRVADTGVGIDKETLPHIFEPFFTTKEPGRGTGLGLSTAYGIVRQSGGYMLVESEQGRGTIFDIYLPRAQAPSLDKAITESPAESCRGSETILMVEDEEGIRILTRAYLEAQGYTVFTAANGIDALSIAREYSGPIHLLLTDVIMPGLRGTELADRLRGDRPGIRVLYVSGYPDEEITDRSSTFLVKPFPMEQLGVIVRKLLDNNQVSAA